MDAHKQLAALCRRLGERIDALPVVDGFSGHGRDAYRAAVEELRFDLVKDEGARVRTSGPFKVAVAGITATSEISFVSALHNWRAAAQRRIAGG